MGSTIVRYDYQQFFGFHRLDMGTNHLAIYIDPIDLLMSDNGVAHDEQPLWAV